MKKTDEVKAVPFLRKLVAEGGVTFALADGKGLEARLDEFSEAMVRRLALHGLSQKIGDASANCAKDKAYGHAFAQMKEVYETLAAGKWSSTRESSSRVDLIQALAELKKLPTATIEAAVARADEITVKSWLKNAAVDARIKEIRATRAKAEAKGTSIEDIQIDL